MDETILSETMEKTSKPSQNERKKSRTPSNPGVPLNQNQKKTVKWHRKSNEPATQPKITPIKRAPNEREKWYTNRKKISMVGAVAVLVVTVSIVRGLLDSSKLNGNGKSVDK